MELAPTSTLAQGGLTGADADILSEFREAIQRAVPRGASLDRELAERAHALGLYALADHDVGSKEQARELYALVLAELAGHHGPLARLVAAHSRARLLFPTLAAGSAPAAVARRVESLRVTGSAVSGSVLADAPPAALRLLLVASPGGWLAVDLGANPRAASDEGPASGTGLHRVRLDQASASLAGEPALDALADSDVLGAMALAVGRLTAGHALALRFAQERELFRRRLISVPAVQAWIAAQAAALARLTDTLRELALGRRQEAPGELWAAFAREALEVASAMSQLMGGTGLMEESLMPAVYREVIALVCGRPAPPPPPGTGRALVDLCLASSGPGGVPLDT